MIYSRAMQQKEIFKGGEDNHMSSRRLFEELLAKAEKEKTKKSPLPLYYRSKRELSEKISEMRVQENEELMDMGFGSSHASQYVDKILDSSDGPHDAVAPIMADMGRSVDKDSFEDFADACEKQQQSNGFTIPQSTNSDLEQQQPSADGDVEEGRDGFSPLELSTRSLPIRTPQRPSLSRSSLRKGYSDATAGSRPQSSLQRGKGESSRSLFQNSNSGAATFSLTL